MAQPQIIQVGPSNGTAPDPNTSAGPTAIPPGVNAGPKGLQTWEATSLRTIVENEMMKDPRFTGLARYLYNLRIFWSYEIPTACAGHGFIFFNPDFYMGLPEETRKTVMVHEVWHLILKHLERGKTCDPEQHNIAADHVINNAIESDGFTFDGTTPMKDPKFRNMSTEQVYNIIYEKQPEKRPKPDPNRVPAEQIEDMIEGILGQDGAGVTLDQQQSKADKDADAAGKGCGSTPGNQGIMLELSGVPVAILDATYGEIFEKYLTDPLSGGKRTFMRPNRRQIAMGGKLRLPGRYPKRGHLNRLKHLTYALDVSGSITKKQATQFHQSVDTIKKLLNPSKLTVLFFDTHIRLEKTFTDTQPYTKIQVHAGGGTDLKDVYARTLELDSEALVIFTDLCVSIPKQQDFDTIWIIPDQNCLVPADIYGSVYLIPKPEK